MELSEQQYFLGKMNPILMSSTCFAVSMFNSLYRVRHAHTIKSTSIFRRAKNAAMGFALNNIFAQRKACKFMLLKTICGIQLWRSGTTKNVSYAWVRWTVNWNTTSLPRHVNTLLWFFQMITALNHLGVSCSYSTILRAVDKLCAEHDAAIIQAKRHLEVSVMCDIVHILSMLDHSDAKHSVNLPCFLNQFCFFV